VRVLIDQVEVGVTHVHEEQNGGIGTLTGLDTTVKLDEQTKIKAEIATTKADKGGANDGSAPVSVWVSRTAARRAPVGRP